MALPPTGGAWYHLTVTDSGYGIPCGVTVDSAFVRVAGPSEIPAALAGTDTTVCPGGTATLGGAGAAGFVYSWSPAAGLSAPDSAWTLATQAGTYALTVANTAGTEACFVDLDTVVVGEFVSPPALAAGFAGRDTALCLGDSVTLGVAAPAAGWRYTWEGSWLSDSSTAQPVAAPHTTGEYSVTATDSASGGACAQARDTAQIKVEEPFTHAAPQDTAFCPGECFPFGVAATPGYSYRWTPAQGLDNPVAPMTVARPTATTVYTLTISSDTMESANCRERAYTATATAGGCGFPTVAGENMPLDFGAHAGRLSLEVWDMGGRLVMRADNYQNRWEGEGLARGMYAYRLLVGGECGGEYVGRFVVVR